MHSRRRWLAATLLAITTLGAAVVTAAPAQAVSGLFEISGTSQTSSATFRTAVATCPPGSKLYGAQATIVTGNGNVALDGVVPSADLQSVVVYATEINAYTQLWRLLAKAVCGPPVAGLQRIGPFATFTDSSSHKAISSGLCPAGLRLYGAGADITAGFGAVALMTMTPGNFASTVAARELFDSYTGNWAAHVYGICGAPSPNMQVLSSTSPSSISTSKSWTVDCPGNTRAHQTGATVLPTTTTNVLLNTVTDTAGTLQQARAEAWQAGGVAIAPWSLSVSVLCAS